VGKQDFAAVKNEGTPVKSTVRTIYYCNVERKGDRIYIRVCADGFLYNMVRSIAGTLMYCGVGKIAPEAIPAILASGDREQAGPTAPACGLYMSALTYNMEALDGRANETHD
jgi:tRNA pseudouridine38-40 synthase